VFSSYSIAVHDLAGEKIFEFPFKNPVRYIRRRNHLSVIADWSGEIVMVTDSGESCAHQFKQYSSSLSRDWKFSIPGDCTIIRDSVLVGFWNGDIFKFTLGEKPRLILNHPYGVQALEASDSSLFISDLKGGIHVYQNESSVFSEKIEGPVQGMKLFKDGLIIIGGEKAYQLSLNSWKILSETLMLSLVTSVYRGKNDLMVIDETGNGIRIDEDLIFKERFHVTAGAYILFTDASGLFRVFAYPDGTRTLMKDGRIVYTHTGVLSLDDTGMQAILGDEKELNIYDFSYLQNLFQRK
jgi:hypothetical protein